MNWIDAGEIVELPGGWTVKSDNGNYHFEEGTYLENSGIFSPVRKFRCPIFVFEHGGDWIVFRARPQNAEQYSDWYISLSTGIVGNLGNSEVDRSSLIQESEQGEILLRQLRESDILPKYPIQLRTDLAKIIIDDHVVEVTPLAVGTE